MIQSLPPSPACSSRGFKRSQNEICDPASDEMATTSARAASAAEADVVAISSLAGSHISFCERLKPLLEQAGLGGKLWIIGGNLPKADHARLAELGFRGIFPSSSRLSDIVSFIRENTE